MAETVFRTASNPPFAVRRAPSLARGPGSVGIAIGKFGRNVAIAQIGCRGRVCRALDTFASPQTFDVVGRRPFSVVDTALAPLFARRSDAPARQVRDHAHQASDRP